MMDVSQMLRVIPLTLGYITVVDQIDCDLSDFKWCALSDFQPYARRATYPNKGIDGKGKQVIVLLHRVILSRILGRELRDGEVVDHIDGDVLNNSRSNLRLATHAENMRNQKRPKNNTSGFKGVTWDKGMNKWRAQIGINRKLIRLGFFDTREEASVAYSIAAKEYHKEFSRLT